MNKKILELLDAHRDHYLSGKVMGDQLAMSRANIWKNIESLRQQGFEIESLPSRGYRLIDDHHVLNPFELQRCLPWLDRVDCFDHLDSTNSAAKRLAQQMNHGMALIVADTQTQGRGRMNRPYFSPAQGLYMSLLMHPSLPLNQIQYITIISALAISDAITQLYPVTIGVKWLNDLFIGTQKLSGILCEGEIEMETQRFRHLVVGMGVNLRLSPDCPSDLRPKITALDQHTRELVDRNAFIVLILKQFKRYYDRLMAGDTSFIQQYRDLNFLIGKSVTIAALGQVEVVTIDDCGQLVVRDSQGREQTINSGEVTLHETSIH